MFFLITIPVPIYAIISMKYMEIPTNLHINSSTYSIIENCLKSFQLINGNLK